MAVLGYQLAIVVTLILVRLISPKHLHGAALVWTALTVINLFWPPLIVLQLVVIWVTYGVLTPSEPPRLRTAVKIARKRQAIDLAASMAKHAQRAKDQASIEQAKSELPSSCASATSRPRARSTRQGRQRPDQQGHRI